MNNTLNKEQQEVYDSIAQRLLVLAGAGTGKTHVMIARIDKIVNELHVPASHILALTFTNAAAFEMKERYRKLSNSANTPEFCTFHAFCYKLISEDFRVLQKIGYIKVPDIVEDVVISNIKSKIRKDLNIKLGISKLESDGTKLSAKDKIEWKMFQNAYKKAVKSSNVITFDILIQSVCKLFITEDPCIKRYLDRYEYIFIDEFQDTDPLQWKFAKKFKDSSIMVIGDVLQAIYQFRNADSSIIKSLADSDDWETIRLVENYRSTKEIVDYANNIDCPAKDYRVFLKAQRSGFDVQTIEITDCDYDGMYISLDYDKVIRFIEDHIGSSAILCRSNREVNSLAMYLKSKEKQFRRNNENSNTLYILKSSIDDEYFMNWILTLFKQEERLQIMRELDIMKSEDVTDMSDNDIIDYMFSHKFTTQNIKNIISDIKSIRDILDMEEYPFEKCNRIATDILKCKPVLIDTDGTDSKSLINCMIEKLSEQRDESLYIGTIHSSKGLEYDNVVVLGVNSSMFRLDDEEDYNLYYVAVTRARENLMVTEVK